MMDDRFPPIIFILIGLIKKNSLVFVSDNTRFLILSSSRTKKPFSLLHSSDFHTAKDSTVSLRDIDNLGSSLSDKLASLKLKNSFRRT